MEVGPALERGEEEPLGRVVSRENIVGVVEVLTRLGDDAGGVVVATPVLLAGDDQLNGRGEAAAYPSLQHE